MDIETKKGPFIRSSDDVGKMMKRVFISLIPIILFAIYKNGILLYIKGYTNFYGIFYPLIFIVLGSMASLVGEEVYYVVFKKLKGSELVESVKKSYGFIPGLFLSLVVPINTPLAILFIGGMISSMIGKMIYGGLGQNIFNPALVGAIIIMVCYGSLIGGKGGYINRYELDAISSSTPLTNYKIIKTIDYDKVVKPYGDLSTFFIGFIPGTLGEVSSLLILVSAIYLIATKTIKWRITLSYILTFLITISIYTVYSSIGLFNIPFQILSGGILFGSVFMATDPVTSPVSTKGQILYGMLLGLVTFLIRTLTNYPEGVMISILLMNVFVLFIDKIGSRVVFNKKYIIYYVIILLVILGMPCYLGVKNKKTIEENVEFKILNVSKDGIYTTYEVSQKGFGGNILADLIFDEVKLIKIDIKQHYESSDRYKLIEDSNYLESLVKDNDIDAVTSATITSNALKNMVKNTLNKFLKDTNGIQLVSKDTNKFSNIYVLRVNGDNGKLDIQIVEKNHSIRTIIMLNYDTDEVIDEYIKNIIVNQSDIDNIEADNTIKSALLNASKYVLGLE